MARQMSNMERMFQELIMSEGLNNGPEPSGDNYDYVDSEEFMTSKDIVDRKEKLEQEFGGPLPATQVRIEEDVHFKRYAKRKQHKYTETEMAAIRESCEITIVHDFGENDEYHMSDEERAKVDMLSEMRLKLGILKRTYHRVDDYVEAMRVVVQAWEMLEKNGNYLHTRDEFFNMVADGKIVSSAILMPKLKKIDNYNIEKLITYISNPELDPKDLLPEQMKQKSNSWYDQFEDVEETDEYQNYYEEYIKDHGSEYNQEEDDQRYDLHQAAKQYAEDKVREDELDRLLDDDELIFIHDHLDSPPQITVKEIPRRYTKDYDHRTIGRKSKDKKLSKRERRIKECVRTMFLKVQSNPNNRGDSGYSGATTLITHGMFKTEADKPNPIDEIYFDGSWANKAQVKMYEIAIREEMLKQHPPREPYLTYGDRELTRFFKILEDNGVSTIELRRKMNISSSGVANDAESKMSKKQNKKMEARLIDRLTKLNDDPKFKKLVKKAEDAINKQYAD